MQQILKLTSARCKMMCAISALSAGLIAALSAGLIGDSPAVMASNATPTTAAPMPVHQQNELVQTYCAVCHNDTHVTGGFSLQHFDAAHADPALAAMLLSKLTGGLPLERVDAAITDQAAAAAVDYQLKRNAINASGTPKPDGATSHAWAMALFTETAGATKWTVNQVQDPASHAHVLTASIIREAPTTDSRESAGADMYRLMLTCNADTRKGEMQLEWAPGGPTDGQEISAAVDGNTPLTYTVEGHEVMGNVTGTRSSGPGNIILKNTPLPEQTLMLGNLVGGEKVVFPFGGLPQSERQALSTCFAGTIASK